MCGIFGISGDKESAKLSYIALFTLQHRGQESAGIASLNKGRLSYYNGMGLVNEVFNPSILSSLEGDTAIGHVRYSTAGSSTVNNSQPIYFKCKYGEAAAAHNGNIVNAAEIKSELVNSGAIFQSDTDSEIIIHLISRSSQKDFVSAAADQLPKLKGAYSFLFLHKDALLAARDPYGFRPLILAKKGKAFIFASETCAASVIGADIIREIEPGEAAVVRGGRISFFRFAAPERKSRCIFEQVYFARPDSIICGQTVQNARYLIGQHLFRELKSLKADIVSGVPDSGTSYALGFSKASGIPYVPVFMRNHYAGRSFIQPDQKMREFTAHLKLAPIKDAIYGRKIVLIDDSLVRGTTSSKIIGSLRKAGAKKIIMAIASPPIIAPCFYGIDTPTQKELIAFRLKEIERIRKFIGADELHYLSLENLIKACGRGDRGFCSACFDGSYPV